MIDVVHVFSAAAVLAVCLRFYARTRQRASFGLDDLLMVPAVICAIGVGVANVTSVTYSHPHRQFRMGRHGPKYGEFLVTLFQCEFASELLSIVSLACAKASIVISYRRIFRGKRFSTVSMILLILIAIWGIAFFFGQLFDCSPIAANWDVFGKYPHANCINPLPMYYGLAASDVVMNLFILAVPQPLVWKLHMPTWRKIDVSIIFLFGAFAIGISAARIGFFMQVGNLEGTNEHRSSFIPATIYWTHLECVIAIICGCLPTLPIIFGEVSPGRVLGRWAGKLFPRSAHAKSKGSRYQG
ncbi:hypothetical protein VMCG_02773 [Cytospora schulzeri]|uniref:Rhodopsin domain-containing protein n=1 Tax=Cytospora schulzeri TaxID=448051 RepID=A0A423WZY8_9PEZI|nr:hypothetical protein VMCG_02773 [Valsa malicola]